jgi:hypothetical protein
MLYFHCPWCGNELYYNEKFCNKCGHQLSLEQIKEKNVCIIIIKLEEGN